MMQVGRAFDVVAGEYDVQRRLIVPCFNAFYGNALEVIDDWGPPPAMRVLDLGSGTGLFAALVHSRHPDTRLHLVDASEAMLAQAGTRFTGAEVDLRVADMATTDLAGPYDLVISALAIHHLPAPDKQALFARIYAALVPRGLFVNAEQVLGPGPEAEARYRRRWDTQVRAAGASEAIREAALERMRHDRCDTVEDQLRWLREAGFVQADCTFKTWRFAVLAAWKG
jgi:ubiquinone/menaquinone biosynthesis C-methylase UbiE